jgi:hypothetical protein
MNTFTIFQHPSGKIEAVKQGWSWPAFLFGFIWALSKRLYGVAAFTFFVGYAFAASNRRDDVQGAAVFILSVVMTGVLGTFGNRWRIENLKSRGYDDEGSLQGEAVVDLGLQGGDFRGSRILVGGGFERGEAFGA